MLEIALLGRFDLRLDDEPLDLASRPQKKLLTYLALNAGLAVPRAKLAGILWLDAPERTARKNLRHHLWRLRQAIGEEYLLTTSDTAAFNSATTYRLDVEVLERSPLDSDLEALIEAISVYRGELLPGFYDDWILLERERLLAAFERRMQTLIDRLTAEKRWPDLIVWAEHWITHAFAPEPAYRALMIGFAALGDRASVVKHYQRCQKALQEELGVEPSAETQALFERLTSGEPLEEIEAIHTSRRIGQSDSFLPEGTVTFLFTDIQGSTELLQALGDQYLALLADHHRILREVFARWHGREVGAEGDSFFVSFPRAAGALAATVEAQRALTTHDWPAGAQVRVRMGLHTGEPWTVEENYAGIDVHRAARIANAGHGGQVLLSETSAALVLDQLPEDVALLDLGWHQLKDMKRAEHIRQLVIEGLPSDFPALKSLAVVQPAGVATGAPARLPAYLKESQPEPERPVFVGRVQELARLDGYLNTALDGNGQVAFLAGDAGSGKTSLLSAFSGRVGDREPDLLVGWGTCNAFSGRGDPYLPFRKALSTFTGDLEAEWAVGTITGEQARAMWAAMPVAVEALLDHGSDLLDTIMPAGPLLSRLKSAYPDGHPLIDRLAVRTTPEQTERAQLFEQVTATFRRLAEERPLVLVLDDLQWADHGSLDLLFHLSRGLAGARILLLFAYRPDEVAANEDHPLLPMLDEFRRSYGDVWLDLNQAPGRAFVDELIDSQANHLDDKFRERLVKQTNGHPLFTVELLRDMQERGDLVQDSAGAWTLGPALDWDALPVRVEGAIAARIGRIEQELRDILSVAAVEGELFTAQVVARVQQVQERKLLRTLSRELSKRHRLVQEDQTEYFGRQLFSFYRFTHHLFQRYLYNDLTETERRLLHGEVGQVLETLYEDKTDEVIVQLARHFDEAGESEKAASYLVMAGDQARLLYANEEAIGHYQRALERLQILGDNERLARTWMRLGLTYHNAFDYQRSRNAYDQGFAAWQRVGIDAQLNQGGATLKQWLVEPAPLDPPLIHDQDTAWWVQQLFCGLVTIGDTMVVVPDVAWRWQIHDGGLTYVFHLREDVKWSDGHPLTAADFIFSWLRLLDPGTEDDLAQRLFDIRGARDFHNGRLADKSRLGLQAPDKHTLIVKLEKPASYFLNLLTATYTFPVPQHKITELGDEWARPEWIVNNGPYLITSWLPHEAAVLRRNPYYHGVYNGNVDRVEVLVTASSDSWKRAMTRYTLGDLDVLYASEIPGDAFVIARMRYGENYLNIPAWGSYCIDLNPTPGPLNNVHLRRALAMDIDRNQMFQELTLEHLSPAQGGWIPPGLPGHSSEIGLNYNPEIAQRLFAQAGYPDGRGFPVLEMVLLDRPLIREMGNCVASRWQKELGITVRPVWLPTDEYLERVRLQTPAIFLGGWWGEYPDPSNFFVPVIRAQDNKDLQEFLHAARETVDQSQRLALYREADKLLIEEALVIPLAYTLGHYFVSSRVRKLPKTLLWQDIVLDLD